MNRAKRPDRRHLRAAARHPTRRDGVIAMALLLLPWATVLVAARRHHHLDFGAVAAVSIGLATLWVAWATLRGPKRPAAPANGLTLGQVADRLAVAVGAQWEAEAAVRRLNDPYPLPVSWGPADASLTDSWDSLLKLAASGAGRSEPPPAETWAAGPKELAGEGGELAEVLARVPTRRLVVLGEPGSGKTMLMVRLVLDLLARRTPGGPVPFLASVASWNPAVQDLRSWLGAQLVIDHPALASPPPTGREEPTQAGALLAAGLILPVLDGLDEIPEQVRGPAISRINDSLRPGEQLLVTCRTQQYRDAVRPKSGVEVTLRAAAAVELRPLTAHAVRSYLRDDAAGPAARTRWDPVLPVLDTEAPAGQTLSTPLMVGLARAIYNPRPGDLAGTLRDPAELCSPALPDRRAVESLLFDAFIPAAYQHDPGGHWKAQDAEKWLVFLARHLERKIASPDLAWWQLPRATPRTAARLRVGVVIAVVVAVPFGVAFGVAAGVAGLVAGVVAGLVAGLVAGAAGWSSARAPARGVRISGRGVVAGAGAWAVIGGGVIVAEGGVGLGVVAAVVLGVAFGVAAGFKGVPGDVAEATSPQNVLARDRHAAFLLMLAGMLGGGVAGMLAGWVAFGTGVEGALGVGVGFGFGIECSLWLIARQSAWPSYLLTVGWLAYRHRLPRSLMGFLADAHQRGVLRQAGAVYQFRHIELQHRLANRGNNETLADQPHPSR